ncbi:MAG: DUF3035 domain-containing protein [Parasphingopyxis sp.]
MRKSAILGALALSATLLTACGSGGLFGRDRPDEFMVSRSAPLVIPPDFALAPPRAGEPSAQGSDTTAEALQAMFGGTAPRSAAEQALLGEAGGGDSNAGIRSTVADPDTQAVDYGTTTRDILNAPEGDAPEAQVSTPQ